MQENEQDQIKELKLLIVSFMEGIRVRLRKVYWTWNLKLFQCFVTIF